MGTILRYGSEGDTSCCQIRLFLSLYRVLIKLDYKKTVDRDDLLFLHDFI
ncbi:MULTISPECIES: hypothetical protein [Desulfitobacterium]|nr:MULTISPECIES: hypothetical protein [Desulfitobacterium]